MKTTCAFLALLALAVVAQTSEAAFCRTSSYKVAAGTVQSNKQAIYKACVAAKKIKTAPTVYKVETKPDGCTLIYQKVDTATTWEAYGNCEKSKSGVDNTKLYTPLFSQSAVCQKWQTKGSC